MSKKLIKQRIKRCGTGDPINSVSTDPGQNKLQLPNVLGTTPNTPQDNQLQGRFQKEIQQASQWKTTSQQLQGSASTIASNKADQIMAGIKTQQQGIAKQTLKDLKNQPKPAVETQPKLQRRFNFGISKEGAAASGYQAGKLIGGSIGASKLQRWAEKHGNGLSQSDQDRINTNNTQNIMNLAGTLGTSIQGKVTKTQLPAETSTPQTTTVTNVPTTQTSSGTTPAQKTTEQTTIVTNDPNNLSRGFQQGGRMQDKFFSWLSQIFDITSREDMQKVVEKLGEEGVQQLFKVFQQGVSADQIKQELQQTQAYERGGKCPVCDRIREVQVACKGAKFFAKGKRIK